MHVARAAVKARRCAAATFREREGRCNVSVTHEEQGVVLGRWLSVRRTAHDTGALDAAQQVRLKELGVVWGMSLEQQ